ncbi:MAG: hypothetical protein K2K04_00265 [Clostridia bacterium]|nr:hypothetical protein [Clostridia bacterium]
MNRHALKTHKTFSSHIEKKVIIGGETDFCAERFGYIQGKNGISTAPMRKQATPLILIENVHMTYCMPTGVKALIAASDGKLYSWKYGSKNRHSTEGIISGIYPSVHSVIVDGAYYNAVVGGDKIAMATSGARAQIYSIPVQLGCSVMHCGRLFAVDLTDGYMLRWSGYSLTDWTEGVDGAGFVRLNPRLGKLLKLFVLGDKIVVLREGGITTITTLGDSRHMRADICDKHGLSDVYPDGSAICRGQLWIYTQKGMLVYDGSTLAEAPTDKIMKGYVLSQPKVIDDRYIYYSALKDERKSLFVYDTETGAGNPFCIGCHSPFFCGEVGYAFYGTSLSTLEPNQNDPDRVWVSEPFTYDENKPAVLKSLTIEGSGYFIVETDCDGRKLYAVGAGKYRYSESAKSFTFKVTGVGTITAMTAEWEVRG